MHTTVAADQGSIGWAIAELTDQGMPPDEIGLVLEADPDVIHRYLELHREWLEERLADRRHSLVFIEQFLAARWEDPAAHPPEAG